MYDAVGTLNVMTPEGVELHLHPAGLYSRMLAALVDHLLSNGALLFLYALLPPVRALRMPILAIGAFAIPLIYHLLWEWYGRGQTPGKRCLGLRVVDARAGTLEFSQVLLRNLLRPIDFLPLFYMVGGLSGWLHRQGRRLGDLAAHTVVVRHQEELAPRRLSAPPASGDNVFRAQPRLIQRLRRTLTPAQVAALNALLLQREELRPEIRLRLCAEAAAALAAAAGLPPVWRQTLPPEQLLRSAVQAVSWAPSSSLRGVQTAGKDASSGGIGQKPAIE